MSISNKYLDIRERFGSDPTPDLALGAIPDLCIPQKDIELLRELGKRVAHNAADPINDQNARLWRSINDIKMEKPAIFLDEICWNEMNVYDELTIQCSHPFAQELEDYLRKQIYLFEHCPGNMVVTPYIECPMVVYDSGFGIDEKVDTVATDVSNNIVSRHFNAFIECMDDVEKIKDPDIFFDHERTMQNFDILSEIFSGIMEVRIVGSKGLWFTPWDYLIRVMGIQDTMMNLIEEPEFINAVVSRYVDASMVRMKKYTDLGVWASNNLNTRVGSGGYGYCSDLDAPKLTSADTKQLWGCGNAQIFSEVSPAMHYEFSLQHELRWISQFGLSYYGCCEPLHHKMDMLKKIDNLRKVSMSPWSKLDVASEVCKNTYVMSCKPSPAIFAGDNWDRQRAKEHVKKILDQTKGCSIELIMKDISTVRYQPQRLWDWVRVAKEAIDEAY